MKIELAKAREKKNREEITSAFFSSYRFTFTP